MFISVLPDVPLAPCYREEPDSLVSFDKPDGRYVEISAICRGDKTAGMEALKFYHMSLPQLGWRIVETDNSGVARYVKNKDIMRVEIESHMSFSRIKVIVQPLPEDLG